MTRPIVTSPDLPFTPCSPDCPAVTGVPINGVRYCAMQERARHRGMPLIGAEGPRPLRHPGTRGFRPETLVRDAAGNKVWVIRDWRDGLDKPVRVGPAPDGIDADTGKPIRMVRFEHDVPMHPDYTDCCANLQCCTDLWDKAGLAPVRDAIVGGAPCVEIVQQGERRLVVIPGGGDAP
jgi:hypothetical protein